MVAKADEEATTKGIQYNSKDEDDEDDDDEDKDTDKEDQELFYFFDCVRCKNIFTEKDNL